MREPASLLRDLEEVCDEIFDRWDKDMRPGKLLSALAGRLSGYSPRVSRIREALSAGWHPISTAPKNGTPVILAVAGNEFFPRSGWWDDNFERWVVRIGMDGENATGLGIAPTHWMPLPEPPPAPCDRSAEGDKTEGLGPKGESTVGEAEAH